MMPAAARTWRCFLTPCRVIARNRSESSAIEVGPPSDNRCSSASRVGSPSAANSNAAPARLRSTRFFDILLQPDQDLGPALAVVPVDLCPPRERDLVEASLRYAQSRSPR